MYQHFLQEQPLCVHQLWSDREIRTDLADVKDLLRNNLKERKYIKTSSLDVPTAKTMTKLCLRQGFAGITKRSWLQSDFNGSETLKILVGQKGLERGGSGGTFVTLLDNTPIIIAGGAAWKGTYADGNAETSGGGGAGYYQNDSGGGAGLLQQVNTPGGKSFINGGDGGSDGNNQALGGFGGGGGARVGRGDQDRGGGGGYSGGNGTGSNSPAGGKSFNADASAIRYEYRAREGDHKNR